MPGYWNSSVRNLLKILFMGICAKYPLSNRRSLPMRFRLDYVLTIVALSSLTAMLAQDQAAQAQKAAAAPKVAAKTAANTTAKAPTAFRSAWKQPRTPEGRPDFTGYWSNSTVTPLERPIT